MKEPYYSTIQSAAAKTGITIIYSTHSVKRSISAWDSTKVKPGR